jgi:hypothetical protein
VKLFFPVNALCFLDKPNTNILFRKIAPLTITSMFALVSARFWDSGLAHLRRRKRNTAIRGRGVRKPGCLGKVLQRQPILRSLLSFAAIASAVALAGCYSESIAPVSARHMQPLSAHMLAELEKRNMAKGSPILVRIFKEESELEVWKLDNTGRFALLHTYPICRWSGDLGPKLQQGDRQAPEGFYTITPELMNPNSNYYLAINTGFPNTYDQANGRTGQFLMIHGDCASAGCYAMTDEQIAEIYALAAKPSSAARNHFRSRPIRFGSLRSTWQGIAILRTWLFGECSSKATTISRSRGKSPRSMSAIATTSSMHNHPASLARPSNVRSTACRRRSRLPFTTSSGEMRRSSRSL